MFKDITLFLYSPAVAEDLKRLPDALNEHRLRPCGPMEMGTRGFLPPVGAGDEAGLTHAVSGRTLLVAGREDKMLPSSVVNEEVASRVQKIAENEGRKVGARERKKIKDDVLNELLPRAFVKKSGTRAYVDPDKGWLLFNTASRKSAENALSMIREALGSFPAVPTAPEEEPRVLMTHWLATGELPAGLAFGDECELRDPASASGAISRSRRQDLDSDEIREHLRTGKQVFQLGLIFEDRIVFVLGSDLAMRKVKFTDVVFDEAGDDQPSAEAEVDAQFALAIGEYTRLISKLLEWFKVPTPEDA